MNEDNETRIAHLKRKLHKLENEVKRLRQSSRSDGDLAHQVF